MKEKDKKQRQKGTKVTQTILNVGELNDCAERLS